MNDKNKETENEASRSDTEQTYEDGNWTKKAREEDD
tara:strand:- start:1 stop:108 length:108 start_codon:yes stop_codon:yes gene_type:complete